jgi:hypothetical protein
MAGSGVRWCGGVVLRSLVLVIAAVRVAAADPEPIRVEYTAPEGCPADVIPRLVARAAVVPGDAPDARRFALRVTAGDGGFRGELTVGGEGTREVTGATCEETVAALVLVAALAVEERAAAPPPPPPPPLPRAPTARWTWSFGAGVARYEGMTPTPIFGVPIHLAASRGRLRLRVTFDATGDDQLAMSTFRWTAGRIDACPYAIAAGSIELAPCAGLQAGALTGRGTSVAQASSATRPWLAPELAARAALRIGPAAVEVEGTAAAPLVRDRYYIAPSTTVHQVPAVAFGVGADIAVHFR